MATSARVRLRVISPASAPLAERIVEDEWYVIGGGRHPSCQQRAREEMAAAELREWLDQADPEPGRYTIAVDDADTRATWARVSVQH